MRQLIDAKVAVVGAQVKKLEDSNHKRFEELQGSIDKVIKALSMREPSGWQPRKAPPLPPPSR